jgi:alkylated DNA nucleotide flippase Atl1
LKGGGKQMANENKKDFNAMLRDDKGIPKIQIVTDEKTVRQYGGDRMYFAPPRAYDAIMKAVPEGYVTTMGAIREYLAKTNGASFTEPITAGAFVGIAAWASHQRDTDKTPYWRTLKTDGELNPKYPGGVEAQRKRLEAEGHTIDQKGRKNIRYYVADYVDKLYNLADAKIEWK